MTILNLMKMEESYRKRSKTLREKEKLLVTSNFSFSHSVFKRLVLHTRKNQGLFGKGLNDISVTVEVCQNIKCIFYPTEKLSPKPNIRIYSNSWYRIFEYHIESCPHPKLTPLLQYIR